LDFVAFAGFFCSPIHFQSSQDNAESNQTFFAEVVMVMPASMPELPIRNESASAPVPTKTSLLAILSLVLGIASFGCSCLTGIPGIVCGILGLKEIEKSKQQQTVPRITGRRLAISGIVAGALLTLGSGLVVLFGIFVPSIEAAREAARRITSVNNIKELGLAMHCHHDATAMFPMAIVGKDGSPLLSWRVAILPFLEESVLYQQLHLDEPWDSPHNLKLLDRMPSVFARPGEKLPPGLTCYLAAAGHGMVLGDPKPPANSGKRQPTLAGTALDRISDGTSKTVLVLEVPTKAAVPWTKPIDWTDDPGERLRFLAASRPVGFLVGWADGSVGVIGSKAAPDAVRAAFTRAGDDFFDADDLQ
jgi:hypothetical protein